MKKTLYVLIVAMVLLLASCSSSHTTSLSQNKKVLGKNGISRPDWVVMDISTKKEHFTSGYGTGRVFETAKQKAKLAADAELAAWINSSVESAVDRYITETDSTEAKTYADTFTNNSKSISSAVLSGVVVQDFWEDTEGGVWVLISVPVKNVQAQIDAAISSTSAPQAEKDKLWKSANDSFGF